MNARSCFKVISVLVLGLMLVSCRSSYRQVEIVVPSDVKDKIENVAPRKEYAFYALDTASPKQVEDLTDKTLLICGNIDSEKMFELMVTSVRTLKVPLFKSLNEHIINENIRCENVGITLTQMLSISDGKTTKVDLPRTVSIYGEETSPKTLSAKCAKLMQQDPKIVLLVKRDSIKPKGKIVEIVFK